MTTQDLANLHGFKPQTTAPAKEITGVYCADLLSWAMGRAPEGCAWCTIMGNINAVAVATLTDVACIILCENAHLDDDARERAQQEGIAIFTTEQPAFEAGLAIAKAAGLNKI